MEVVKSLTIKLSEEEVKTIISNYLKKEGYDVSTDDVNCLVSKKWTEDYNELYQNEVLCFDGCVIRLTE